MHIPQGELVFGVAPAILIDCAKQLTVREGPFDEDRFCRALGAPAREARPVLSELERAGYVVPSDQPGFFEGTQKLNQLALASISDGLTRAAADALLAKVLAAARTVNAAPATYPRGVRCIAIFGSYLTDKQILGDLDLGVALEADPAPRTKSIHWREALQLDAAKMNKTYAALRLRKPKQISIHEMKEVVQLGTPFRVVFGVWAADGRSSAERPDPGCVA